MNMKNLPFRPTENLEWMSHLWSLLVRKNQENEKWIKPLAWIGGPSLVVAVLARWGYERWIRHRLADLETMLQRGLVYRCTSKQPRRIRCLELHPDFVEQCRGSYQLVSLGEYLSSLRPFFASPSDGENCTDTKSTPKLDNFSRVLEEELERTVASILLQRFGPRMGAALPSWESPVWNPGSNALPRK